jgi:hypothetical protein
MAAPSREPKDSRPAGRNGVEPISGILRNLSLGSGLRGSRLGCHQRSGVLLQAGH